MAPTPTTRLALLKPAPADLYDVAIDNGNMDILDRVGGLTFCTSTTRPASPFPGMEIYETDTALHLAWLTPPGAWTRITPGFVGGKRYSGADATLTTMANNVNEQLTGMDTGSLPLAANKTYRITAFVEYDDVANNTLLFRIRSTDLVGTTWTKMQARPQVSAAVRQQELVEAIIFTGGIAGNFIFVLTAQRSAVNATVPRIYRSTTTLPFMTIELMGGSSVLTTV